MIEMDLLNATAEELEAILSDLGEKAFRARQIFQWMHRGVKDFDQMTDLPKELREKLKSRYRISSVKIIQKLSSKDGQTTKYLFLLPDDNIIECVAMKYKYGNTLCLSTQVGCRMGCSFCASTKEGLVRNLKPGEMLAQVLQVNSELASEKERAIKNIVLMGSGEPLDNYDNTIKFLRLVNHPLGLHISARNITLSTCGLVPGMMKLAHEGLPITLAISLHAPNDELRKRIMPVGGAYSIQQVIEASKYYFHRTGRRVTFEYALIEEVNDKREHAEELARLLKGFPCHVNVIPVNEIEETDYKRSSEERIGRFISILSSAGIAVTRRRELGQDIKGACGQLKRGYLKDRNSSQ